VDPVLVMFDVDGTLTHSNELDTRCFVQAMREVFGFDNVDEDWSHYTHTSDSGIIEELFQLRRGRSPKLEELARYQARFFELLGDGLHRTPMQEIAGARKILERLSGQATLKVALASGAWRGSARAKMLSAGLPFDDFPGAFSEDAAARTGIMLASRQHAARHFGVAGFRRWIYFGDAVWDARACAELEIPLIGIATGERAELLRRAGAREVLADYSDLNGALAAIERAAA
jgi:phosphoglycolate phosphatase-like HAD superfamily hydrolase